MRGDGAWATVPSCSSPGCDKWERKLSLHDMDDLAEFSTESRALGRPGLAAVPVLTASDILHRQW